MRSKMSDLGLFALRVFAGSLMLTHGLPKLVNFQEVVVNFPDPIGLGSETSLMLVTGAEVGCALLLIFGILTRVAALPLFIAMCVAVIHQIYSEDPFRSYELPILYAAAFLCIVLAGPGSPSVDRAVSSGVGRFRNRKSRPHVPPVPPVTPQSRGGYTDPDATSEDVSVSDWDSSKTL